MNATAPGGNGQRIIGQEHPEHPHRAPLHGPAELGRRASLGRQRVQRAAVQLEELLQLRGRGFPREAAIAGDLLIREKFERHDPGT